MTARLNPYLGFRNQARDALNFYQSVFGGELQLMTFGENGMQGDEADKIMHGQLETAKGFTLMASDTPQTMDVASNSNITVSLSGDEEALLTGYWHGLAKGGQISEPLVKAPWGDTFGMLTDQFGTRWMVNITGQH
ncbi:VOC family protein [Devosia sp. XJ19-1]|uniref:VOC family protein n=1 Tax=Devosia ureilytica TaxID=2952754 RepID=A0A9Q4FR98_9HYPH|nr:VOC family protein [Devosia ureilytica]MCP8882101.1 VOC family protein [Devosia ureilytica]MCP8886013.1 VOC family protein [Devosia ureilytica]